MVYKRLIELPKNHSFFLFGPRGTGKTTLIREWSKNLGKSSRITFIDLLDPATEERYAVSPGRLKEELAASQQTRHWCIIDEIQKIPALLDVAHWAIENKKVNFALTGSSARKLKRGRGNLLAGRAFDFKLHPFSCYELGDDFDLNSTLRFGSLPGIFALESAQDKIRFLESYSRTYLREEIQIEQLVRNVQRFRRFLSFAAQMNAKILNFAKLSATSGVDPKSVNRYFEILEDTLVGVLLEPYDRSIRRRQSQKPKFYLFDTGITCQLREDFSGELKPSSSFYGELFEQWFILECHRLRDYYETRDHFYYLSTKDGAEIDLIIERAGQPPVLVEIKSSTQISHEHTRHLVAFKKEFKRSRAIVACLESKARLTDDGVEILPYSQLLHELWKRQKS